MSPTPSWSTRLGGERLEPFLPSLCPAPGTQPLAPSPSPAPCAPAALPVSAQVAAHWGRVGDSGALWGHRGRVSAPARCWTVLLSPSLLPCWERPACVLRRTMYWSDWGNHPKIETAAMDGTLRETLVQDNIQWPTGEQRRAPAGAWGVARASAGGTFKPLLWGGLAWEL